MLDFKDYSELILDGVRPSLLETAECGFRAIFEASPAVPARSDLKVIPWEELAGLYGVDTEDCKVDGAVNKKKLARKMQKLPVIGEMFDFVHRAIDRAKEYADVDAFPELDTDPRYNTMISNIRTDLLVRCLKTAASDRSGFEWWKSDEFASLLGKRIAEKFIPSSPAQLPDANSNSPSYANSKDYSDMDDEFVPVGTDASEGTTVYVDGNGHVWYLEESGEYRCTIPYKDDSGQSTVWTVTVLDGEITQIGSSDWTVDHERVSSLCEFLAYGPELRRNPDAGNYFGESNVSFKVTVLCDLPLGIIVDLAMRRPSLLAGFDPGEDDDIDPDGPATFWLLAYMVRLVAEGILDGDSLRDMRARLDRTRTIQAKLNIVADCLPPSSYGKLPLIYRDLHGSDRGTMGTLHGCMSAIYHFVQKFCSDDVISLVTGESRDDRVRKLEFSNLCDHMGREAYAASASGAEQVRAHSMYNRRYASPGDAFFKQVFHSENFDPIKSIRILEKLCELVEATGLSNRKQLYADIRKYITPRVQRNLLAANPNLADELFHAIAKQVPGFRYYTAGGGDLNRENYVEHEISPKALLKLMKYFLSGGSRYSQLENKIAKELLRPATIERLGADHPDYVSRRIMEILGKIYSNVDTAAGLLHGFIYADDIDNPVTPVIENYFAPYADRLDTAFDHVSITSSSSNSVRKLYRQLLTFGLMYLDEKPDEASRLFLDEGGVFPKLRTRYWLEGLLAVALNENRPLAGFGLKAASVSIAKEHELLSALCKLSNYANGGRDDLVILSLIELVELDKYWSGKTDSPLIPADDFARAIKDTPEVMLRLVPHLDKERAAHICDSVLTPEFLNSLASTEGGLKTLLALASQGGWDNFTAQFVMTNETRLRSLLSEVEKSDPALAAKLSELLAKLNISTQKHAVTRTVEHDSLGNRAAQCSVVNGISWDRGFVDIKTERAVKGPAAMLYGIDDVREIMQKLAAGQWRLPTTDELMPLSDNPATIAELQMGFGRTGFADANGNIPRFSTGACYAWCLDEGEPSIYRVSNSDIDPFPGDVDPDTCMAAIKPVKG